MSDLHKRRPKEKGVDVSPLDGQAAKLPLTDQVGPYQEEEPSTERFPFSTRISTILSPGIQMWTEKSVLKHHSYCTGEHPSHNLHYLASPLPNQKLQL